MSYRSANSQESYGNAGSTCPSRQTDNSEERSFRHMPESNDENRSGSRVNVQRGSTVGEGSGGHYGEDTGSTHGGSSQNYRETSGSMHRSGHRGSLGAGTDGASGSCSSGRERGSLGGSFSGASAGGYSGGQTGGSSGGHTGGYGGSSSGNASGGQTERYGDSSSRYAGGSSGGQSGGCGGSTSGVSGSGYSGGNSSGHRVGFSGSSSGATRSGYSGGNSAGGNSGGVSSTSGTAYSSRSSAGRQGFGGGLSSVHGSGGFRGVSGGSSIGGQRGGFGGGFSSVSPGGFSHGVGDGLLQAGEKETMQNLNTRLATYLEKVRALEDSNSELEGKIRHWYESQKPEKVDNSNYYKTIEDLKNKILAITLENNHIKVEVDNARLAADDFRVKYESELCMYQSVESDINGLRKVLDDLTLDKASLESQLENLREELAFLKKNHEEEMKSMQGASSNVNVQLDAAPGSNILKLLNDMRAEYEDLAEENRRKAEEEYNQKISELDNEISCSGKQLETSNCEVTELRRTMQTMEIDLQTQLAMKNSLENTLAETEGRYCSKLGQIQGLVRNLEEQLSQLRSDMETQSREYKLLLDIKTRLENEIEMYRRLLDGEGGSNAGEWSSRHDRRSDSSPVTDPKKSRHVTTITEERENGRIVSTKVDKIEQKI
ncbi:keratin, type I cytoskeletal 12-like [Mixophyes fleayi]|uniref:keratin, type I cytoskeletal 12-like n=1 Tax=Mixophyes fleayi TaxID=3061075 RepID=UPI003F4D74ED